MLDSASIMAYATTAVLAMCSVAQLQAVLAAVCMAVHGKGRQQPHLLLRGAHGCCLLAAHQCHIAILQI